MERPAVERVTEVPAGHQTLSKSKWVCHCYITYMSDSNIAAPAFNSAEIKKRQSNHIGVKRPYVMYASYKSQTPFIPSFETLCSVHKGVWHLCDCFAFSASGLFSVYTTMASFLTALGETKSVRLPAFLPARFRCYKQRRLGKATDSVF